MCVEAGFDCLEIHLGHNYLLSSFLSPALNRRKDRWGGSLENRARFARQVVKEVREAVGDKVAVIAKLNMEDGYKGGLKIDQRLELHGDGKTLSSQVVVRKFGLKFASVDGKIRKLD